MPTKPTNSVAESLRRRDRLIAHRKRCRLLPNVCPKCALLRLHEDMVNLRNAIKFCDQAGVDHAKLFAVLTGVLRGGV